MNNMQTLLLVRLSFIFFIIPLSLQAQVLGVYTKYYKAKQITKYCKKDCKEHSSECKIENINDTLFVEIKDIELIKLKCTFKEASGYCNYQEYSFTCSKCIDHYIHDILNRKYFSWRKISDDKYLSDYTTQTELTIKKDVNSETCLVVKLVVIDKPRKAYNAYYDTLENVQEFVAEH